MIRTIACTYVCSYLSLLSPMVCLTESAHGVGVGYREVDYRYGGRFSNAVFAPMHFIDRQVRPDYWDSYCTLDDVIRDEKQPWGYIHYINGIATSIDIYADDRADLEILDKLGSFPTLVLIRVTGEAFENSDLKKLRRLKHLKSIAFMETKVTSSGARRIRRALPNCRVLCIQIRDSKLERY